MAKLAEAPTCQLCGKTTPSSLRRAALIGPALVKYIDRCEGNWDPQGWICTDDLHKYQNLYVRSILEEEKGELTNLELEVLEGLKEHEILSRNPDAGLNEHTTFGQRTADKIAAFGGSWGFIISFSVALMGWMVLNSVILARRPFDPYPYILLNLILSALASIQAPVIMMSQNRQEARDRLHAQHDYQVNLKAELEIRQLHQKVDHLLTHQWERLVEIQEIQMELINEIRAKK